MWTACAKVCCAVMKTPGNRPRYPPLPLDRLQTEHRAGRAGALLPQRRHRTRVRAADVLVRGEVGPGPVLDDPGDLVRGARRGAVDHLDVLDLVDVGAVQLAGVQAVADLGVGRVALDAVDDRGTGDQQEPGTDQQEQEKRTGDDTDDLPGAASPRRDRRRGRGAVGLGRVGRGRRAAVRLARWGAVGLAGLTALAGVAAVGLAAVRLTGV